MDNMEQYIRKRAVKLKRKFGDCDVDGLLSDSLNDPKFHALFNAWVRGKKRKALAPCYFIEKGLAEWVTFSEAVRRRAFARDLIDKGVRPLGKRWRARGMMNGVYSHLGVFSSKDEALKAVERARGL